MSAEPAVGNAIPRSVDAKDSQVLSDLQNGEGKGKCAFIVPVDENEPVVTRRELWSYYCEHYLAHSTCARS